MSDVINSIFGRAQNETPSSEGYGYGTAATETVDADTTETTEAVEPAEDTTEVEDAADETTDVDEADDSAEADTDEADSTEEAEEDETSDEAVTEEAADGESDEDTDTDSADEAVAEEADVAEEPAVAEEVAVAEEPAAVEETPAVATAEETRRTRGSTTVADGVVSKIVIRVARKAEGVYELDEAGTSVEVDGEVATIAVTLVVEFGRAVKALAEQIRLQVVEAVEDYLGLEVASVDVHVADIHFPDAD